MAKGLPGLQLAIRPVVVLDSDGDPWTASGMPAYEAIQHQVDAASSILSKAGIGLTLVPGSPFYSAYDDLPSTADRQLIDSVWRPSQPWIDVLFVREFVEGTLGYAWLPVTRYSEATGVGIAPVPSQRAFDTDQGGVAIAHEIAHVLGLPHLQGPEEERGWLVYGCDQQTAVSQELISLSFEPFSDETTGLPR